jgi:hypothetical protein
MPHGPSHPLGPVLLRLPNGAQYHLDVNSDDLAARLAPGRIAPTEPGPPVELEVIHRGGRHSIPVGPKELAGLLSHATLEADHASGHAAQPRPVPDPSRGRGLRDPDAHRLGPNASRPQDPGHRGAGRRRTP